MRDRNANMFLESIDWRLECRGDGSSPLQVEKKRTLGTVRLCSLATSVAKNGEELTSNGE